MITGLIEEYGKFKYLCIVTLFLLKVVEKLALLWIDNVSIMRGGDTDNIIREIFKSFLHDYQEELKIIKGSDFVFESVELMDYKLHRVRLSRGG